MRDEVNYINVDSKTNQEKNLFLFRAIISRIVSQSRTEPGANELNWATKTPAWYHSRLNDYFHFTSTMLIYSVDLKSILLIKSGWWHRKIMHLQLREGKYHLRSCHVALFIKTETNQRTSWTWDHWRGSYAVTFVWNKNTQTEIHTVIHVTQVHHNKCFDSA
jgi:hypothetical protein